MGEKVLEIRSINSMYKIHGEVKNSIENGEAKKLTCTTHRHELRWENASGRSVTGQRGIKERKKWDNCNSIINKIYLKMKSVLSHYKD